MANCLRVDRQRTDGTWYHDPDFQEELVRGGYVESSGRIPLTVIRVKPHMLKGDTVTTGKVTATNSPWATRKVVALEGQGASVVFEPKNGLPVRISNQVHPAEQPRRRRIYPW
ncbi:hypothetical protein KKD61_01975 [Patescibacteria group bacterium]|nr:hypothetical protein [Patescibacteria group bacterium]